MNAAKRILLWLALAIACFLPTAALTTPTPENCVWEIFSIGYDAATAEATDLESCAETSTSDYDTAPIYRAVTEKIPTEANRSLFGPNAEFKAAEEGTTLYRAVSSAEHSELMATNVFKAGPNSLGGKFFAESAEDAAQWGDKLEGAGNYKVISATFPKSAADSFIRWDRLDGIGPARYGELDELNAANPIISTVKQ